MQAAVNKSVGIRQYGIAAAFYALVFIAYTWPLAQHMGTWLFYENSASDVPVFYNNIYLVKEKITHGESPLHNDLEMYPMGFSMLMNAHNFIMGIFCLLFSNNILGLNVALLLCFILSGLGAMKLAYRFIPNIAIAVAVGFIFAFSPWKMMKLQNHLWYALTAAIPFYVYHFIDVFDYGKNRLFPTVKSWRKLVYCALLGLATALSEYYLMFFLVYFSLLYMLFSQYTRIGEINFRKAKPWLVVLAVFIGLSVLVGIFDSLKWDSKGAFYWSGDLLAYLLPVYKPYFAEIFTKIPARAENYFFFGFAFMALCIWIIAAKNKQGTPLPAELKVFLGIAIVFILFTVPRLQVGGKFFFNSPTAVVNYIPFFNNVRVTTRFFLMVSLLLPVIIFWYYNTSRIKYKNIVVYVLLALLLIEYYPKKYLYLSSKDWPEYVDVIKNTPGTVLCFFPFSVRDGFNESGKMNTAQLYYETIHGKKIIGGYTARLDPKILEYYEKYPFMVKSFRYFTDHAAEIPTQQDAEDFFRAFSPDVLLLEEELDGTPYKDFVMSYAASHGYSVIFDKNKTVVLSKTQ